jgi:tetraacyldisaccharide-1-P 4'-kinase
VIVVIEENGDGGLDPARLAWIRRHAPRASVLRFRRSLAEVSPLGAKRDHGRTAAGADTSVRALPPAGLLSGIGAPERFDRFARGAGADVLAHVAFPDHAAWTASQIERAVGEAARQGAKVILTTEKDEARWPATVRSPLPILVLRTRLVALDPVDDVLERARGPMASTAAIG